MLKSYSVCPRCGFCGKGMTNAQKLKAIKIIQESLFEQKSSGDLS